MASDIIFRTSAFGGFNKTDVLMYINELKNKENELNEQIKLQKEQIEEINKQLSEKETIVDNLKNEYEAEIAQIKADYESKLSESVESDRVVQEKIGSAMIDVRRYADLLLHETCDKINKMSDDADKATAITLSRILDISSGIQTFSDKLNSILVDIVTDNEDICKQLTQFKASLKIPYDQAAGKLEAELLSDDL